MTSKMTTNNKNILKSGLYIIATPIGNLSDISFRAIETLQSVDLIACEDTRVSKILLDKYGIKTPTISIHNYNESEKIDFVKSKILEGMAIALISDAGTPLISDPGYKLVNALRLDNFYITTVPGATSTISALVLSGLPTDRFMFIGFVPTKNNERDNFFEKVKNIDATVIFFETANRLTQTLKVIDNIFGNRQIAIVREITKIYEEVKRDTASNLLSYFTKNQAKGEFIGVIAPCIDEHIIDTKKIENMLLKLLKTMSLKDASEFISSTFDISKKNVYNIGLQLKKED